MILHGITLYQVRLPLTTPYKVAYRVYNDFDPIFVRLRDTNGNEGWGEGHISPGYSHETVENGWDFCRETAVRHVSGGRAPTPAAVDRRQPGRLHQPDYRDRAAARREGLANT